MFRLDVVRGSSETESCSFRDGLIGPLVASHVHARFAVTMAEVL
jgi:hypothetical protein